MGVNFWTRICDEGWFFSFHTSSPLSWHFLWFFHSCWILWKLVSNDTITFDHLKNSWIVNFPSVCREEISSLLNFPNLSSHHCEELEGEISCFQSSPLYDLSEYEDSSIFYLEIYDRGCHDLFTHSSHHNSDFSILDFSKSSVFDDIPFDDLELPQAVKALQPELMVMSSFFILEISSNSSQNSDVSLKDPHHSSAHIENQSLSHFLHPPSTLYDPITQLLEESYFVSMVAIHKFSSFFMFSHFHNSKVFLLCIFKSQCFWML